MTTLKTSLKTSTKPVGFALYVGISEAEAQASGLSLAEIATALKAKLSELLPEQANQTYAALALAPEQAQGNHLALTRLALREPRATGKLAEPEQEDQDAARGLVVDLKRRRLFVDGRNAQLTCKEFELLAFLIENTGKTVTREEIASISERCGESRPNVRTIDVHVRRLRSKITGYEDVVRTARGLGYRFDKHPDVLIEEL
jgi:DNA-binding response OmpR family regulator